MLLYKFLSDSFFSSCHLATLKYGRFVGFKQFLNSSKTVTKERKVELYIWIAKLGILEI